MNHHPRLAEAGGRVVIEEDDAESIMRLAEAVWLIGQLLMGDEEAFEAGPALKQLAEEIQRYAKPVARG
jgi:hypothetical protein